MSQSSQSEPILRVAQVVPCTEAEGPGKRFALWFQGCPFRCPGCCNPEFLSFDGGEAKPLGELAAWMECTRNADGIEGITLLGGEPFSHAAGAAALAREARGRNLSVMVFSGYTLAQIRTRSDPFAADLLAHTDILVDGPYLRDQPDDERRWVGSRNQQIHFLTDRYRFDESWRRPNTLEIRLVNGELTLNGFPAKDAVGLWKGWARPTRPAVLPGTNAR